jgi:hypothetical protein
MTEKRKPGRPTYEPTDRDRAQIKLMAAMGIPDYDIAKVMQISAPTMRKYFAHELEVGHIEATAKVAQSLFKQATDSVKPNASACMFWLKCRAGWREDGGDIGKKEQQQQTAQTSHHGTTWETLLQ